MAVQLAVHRELRAFSCAGCQHALPRLCRRVLPHYMLPAVVETVWTDRRESGAEKRWRQGGCSKPGWVKKPFALPSCTAPAGLIAPYLVLDHNGQQQQTSVVGGASRLDHPRFA
jgi:hypothetical protein